MDLDSLCAAAKMKTLWEKVIQVCETAPRISPVLIMPGHNTHKNQETLMDLHRLLWSRKLPAATTGWYQVHALTCIHNQSYLVSICNLGRMAFSWQLNFQKIIWKPQNDCDG